MEEGIGNFEIEYNFDEDQENPGQFFVNTVKDLKKYVAESRNINTKRKINQCGAMFINFVTQQGFKSVDLKNDFSPQEMSTLIGQWILSLRKKDGEEYEPDSLSSYFRGLGRYLEDIGYEKNIINDHQFETTRNVLAAKRKTLKGKGLGNKKNKSEALTVDDEEQMWKENALGDYDAETLQNSVWYLLAKNLGFRGCQESRQLCLNDLEKKETNDGRVYYEWTEKSTKTRDGNSGSRPFNPKIFADTENPARCPIRLLELFISKRPPLMCKGEAPLFLAINYAAGEGERPWYKCQPMGINNLGKIMRRMTTKAGLAGERKLTNHSIRKTCCSRLLEAGVPPTAVMQISGHKNVASLNNYSSLNLRQQESIADILAGNDTVASNIPGQKEIGERKMTAIENISRPSSDNQVAIQENPSVSEQQNVVFNITNSGGGSIQIIYGSKPSITSTENEIMNSQNFVQDCQRKRKRVMPLCHSDSD